MGGQRFNQPDHEDQPNDAIDQLQDTRRDWSCEHLLEEEADQIDHEECEGAVLEEN